MAELNHFYCTVADWTGNENVLNCSENKKLLSDSFLNLHFIILQK